MYIYTYIYGTVTIYISNNESFWTNEGTRQMRKYFSTRSTQDIDISKTQDMCFDDENILAAKIEFTIKAKGERKDTRRYKKIRKDTKRNKEKK